VAAVLAVSLVQLLQPIGAAAADEPAKPSLAPIVEQSSRQITACGSFCGARDLLFGSSESLTVAVRQTGSAAEVTPVSQKVVLQRPANGSVTVLSGEDVRFETAKGASAQDRFTVDLGGLSEPGEYVGALLFATADNPEQVSIATVVKVRAGPLGPILLLILTVALGALTGYLLDLRPAARFRRDAIDLGAKIKALPESERSVLMPLWEQMWDGRGEDAAKAGKRLAALTAGAEALRLCRDVQDEALRSTMAFTLTAWVQRIGNATHRLVAAVQAFADDYDEKVALVRQAKSELDDAVETKEEIDSLSTRARAASASGAPYLAFREAASAVEKALGGASPDATQPVPDLDPLRGRARRAFDALEKAHGKPLEEVPSGFRAVGGGISEPVLAAVLGWSSPAGPAAGTDQRTMFDVRAFLGGSLGTVAALGVMLILLAVGFKVTYLDNPTFGVSLTDWLTLAFWGFAAYGARKTLTGLGPTATPAPGS
jgi:hypothetical protein